MKSAIIAAQRIFAAVVNEGRDTISVRATASANQVRRNDGKIGKSTTTKGRCAKSRPTITKARYAKNTSVAVGNTHVCVVNSEARVELVGVVRASAFGVITQSSSDSERPSKKAEA